MKLVELFAVQDVFATALGRVDVLGGGFARFVWYVERTNEDGSSDKIIVASIIMSTEVIAQNRELTNAMISGGKRAEPVMIAAGVH